MVTARLAFGNDWPLFEFWSDKVAPFRKIMDDFTESLMEEAFEKRKLELAKGADAKVDNENDNLLAHLIRHTQGN